MMSRPSTAPAECQLTFFPHQPYTRYTWAVEQLIRKMRRGFIELPELEEKLINLGIFEEREEIDVLWAHTIYSESRTIPQRDAFLNLLWHPILRALDTLNGQGLRALPQVRKMLARAMVERRSGYVATLSGGSSN